MGTASFACANESGLVLIESPANDLYYAGIAYLQAPAYSFSANQKSSYVPDVEMYRHEGFFLNSASGLGWNFASDNHWQYGVSLDPYKKWPVLKTEAESDNTISGNGLSTHDARYRIEGGPFLNIALWDGAWLLSSVKRHTQYGGEGITRLFGMAAGMPLGQACSLSIVSGGVFATPGRESAQTRAAKSGLQQRSNLLEFDWDVQPNWSFSLDLERERLLAHPAAALVLTPTASTTALTLSYRLH
ncbi:MAG TPA: MipA/OmpV family protein [Pseudomonadales bacterium]|nr:MipA/OmpV family protein [Pseudomonadales bacterium]